MDWLRFHTPPRAGGLNDQPKLLMHRMRVALNTYQCVKAYRTASRMSPDAYNKWQGQNGRLINFLTQYVWKMGEENGE